MTTGGRCPLKTAVPRPRMEAATPSTVAAMRSLRKASVLPLKHRIVPKSSQVSAMMLWARPPAILPKVTTAGSKGLTSRLTRVWS